MKIAVLGTGDVGKMLGDRLLAGGHAVRMGSRTAGNEKAAAWAAAASGDASTGTFADAAAWADMVLLAVSGMAALDVVASAKEALAGKVVIDLTNPLDFSQGFPPRLSVCNDDSLGEQIQRAVPDARIVKTLNTLSNPLMLAPGQLEGPHDVLLCGNDPQAKSAVRELLVSFGWNDPIDLGDITNARGLEMWLPLWVRLFQALGTPMFNLHVQR
ncbi:MAG: NAD(P)-binding domain-containing protein [Alphaproteobacteria bacterium]|nr:NAD(P)-binding domain-containing protein [Alphaproteobacteria bacterium]MCB9692650.1 NAD(P)-binding domain-containing protein [Alphaproteobacteria bacterium]